MANTIWVGPDQQYQTIADAVSASHSGDTIMVEAGTYVNDWSSIDHDLTIEGAGGNAHIVNTTDIDNGKADFVVNANLTIENMEFSGASVPDANGAGIRQESGNLTVINSSFHDNQEGILVADNPDTHVVIQGSSFVHNGAGDGQSHGAYIGQVASLDVDNSTFSDQVDGNQLKSRAAETTVTNSHFTTGADGANYDIDLPNGGVASIHDNTFEKDAGTNNPAIIHFGGEIDSPVGSLVVEHNSFTANITNATAVLDQTDLPVTVDDNTMHNIANDELGGAADMSGNYDGAPNWTETSSAGSGTSTPSDPTPPSDGGSGGDGSVTAGDPPSDPQPPVDAAPPPSDGGSGTVVAGDPPSDPQPPVDAAPPPSNDGSGSSAPVTPFDPGQTPAFQQWEHFWATHMGDPGTASPDGTPIADNPVTVVGVPHHHHIDLHA